MHSLKIRKYICGQVIRKKPSPGRWPMGCSLACKRLVKSGVRAPIRETLAKQRHQEALAALEAARERVARIRADLENAEGAVEQAQGRFLEAQRGLVAEAGAMGELPGRARRA